MPTEGPGMTPTDIPLRGPEDDRFGFHEYAATLATLIGSPSGPHSLTMGIYGPWGSGKTSLMRLIAHALCQDRTWRGGGRFSIVWFEAWRYARHDTALWRALLISVIAAMRADPDVASGINQDTARELDSLSEQIYRSVESTRSGPLHLDLQAAILMAAHLALLIMLLATALTVAAVTLAFVNMVAAFVAGTATLLIGVMLSAFSSKLSESLSERAQSILRRQETHHYQAQIQSLEQFHQAFAQLVERIHTQRRQRLVIFIDDLDRCMPEQAIGVLEAVKIFFSLPHCFVVIGVDERVVERGLATHYRDLGAELGGRDYLEKIIQYQVDVPAVAADDAAAFVGELVGAALYPGYPRGSRPAADIARTLAAGAGGNPRALRRATAMLQLLHCQVAASLERGGREIVPRQILAAIVAVRYHTPGLYTYFRNDPGPAAARLIAFPGKLHTNQFKDDELRQILGMPETGGSTIAQAHPVIAAIFSDLDLRQASPEHLRAVLGLFSTFRASER